MMIVSTVATTNHWSARRV